MLPAVFGISTAMGLPIGAGGSGTYTYAWDLIAERDTPKFTSDSTHDSNVYFGWEYYPRAYLYVTETEGRVEWHFQTDAGSTFADDVTVDAAASFYSSLNNWVIGEWSSDGAAYHEFNTWNYQEPGSGTFALSDSGYTGGSDLFLRFTLHRESGNALAVQLFRSAPGNAEFVVTGSVNPVPEPATMLLLGSGLAGLAGFRRKWAAGRRSE
jgi:hypothetical protein